MPNGIIIFGLNGSGKSTLARALAKELSFKCMDIEDYVFMESEIPYTKERSRAEWIAMMKSDIKKHESFVIATCKGDLGEEISSAYRLAVFLDVPYETRITRIEERSLKSFGDRVRPGGDMYEMEQEFLEFVKSRDIESVTKWSATLQCPILTIDGRKKVQDSVKRVKEYYLNEVMR